VPLNISIDVDGTLLDENEKPVREARESLQLLKDAGYCLQLWSGGGTDYAYKHALKNKLTDLFDSYAKKPDVVIDDLPETARPLAIVHVDQNHPLDQAVKRVFNIEQNVDATLTLSSALVNFVQQMQAEKSEISEKYKAILDPKIPLLHPIPFFGVIEKARAITIGLNPSATEFKEARSWSPILTPSELTHRLVNYFRLREIAPHYWFAELQWALDTLHCPYSFAAAHIDASPWATHPPTILAKKNPRLLEKYNQLLDAGIQNWLPKTFEFCRDTVKLIVICSTDEPKQAEARRLPVITKTIKHSLGGNWVGKIIVLPKSQFPRWAWENREELVHLLDLENIFP